MGRKSDKGKLKKKERKEELAKDEKLWMLVKAANDTIDPLEPFISFKRYCKNGISVDISCQLGTSLDKTTMNWAFDLTKDNMETLYEDCEWGWKDREKWAEFKDSQAWFLLATSEEAPVAFIHFRFDMDFGDPVLYCYEIQLVKHAQRKGLGVFMMQILQLMAIRYKMKKVVATVLESNEASKSFFKNKLKFTTDESNLEDEFYEIVSKPTNVQMPV